MSENNVRDSEVSVGKTTKARVLNFVALILCFLASIGLWFYVQDYDSPNYEKKFTNISVDIVGGTSGLSVLSGYDNTVDVTVVGRKSDINRIFANDITAQIDISEISKAGTFSLPVTVILPNGLEVSALSSTDFWLYIDKTATANVPVIVRHTGYTDGELIVGTAVAAPLTVAVTGPESVLSDIAGAYCELSLGRIEGSVSATQSVVLKDKSGADIKNPYITTSTETVSVSIPVYVQKALPVTAQFIGGVHALSLATINASPESITVRGTVEAMKGFDSIVVDVDESLIDGSGNVVVPLAFPNGIEAVGGEKTAELEITLLNNASRVFSVSGFEAVNVPDGMTYTVVTESVNVKLRGIVDALFAFNAQSSVKAKADLSVLSGKPSGTYQIPLTIDTNYASTAVYCFGSYTVEVTVQ